MAGKVHTNEIKNTLKTDGVYAFAAENDIKNFLHFCEDEFLNILVKDTKIACSVHVDVETWQKCGSLYSPA